MKFNTRVFLFALFFVSLISHFLMTDMMPNVLLKVLQKNRSTRGTSLFEEETSNQKRGWSVGDCE